MADIENDDSAVKGILDGPPAPDDRDVYNAAEAAEDDLEAVLSELEIIQGERGRWTSKKGDMYLEYERLRKRATELLGDDGPRYFLDRDGSKMVAVKQQAEPVVIDPEILEHLPVDVVDEIAPRKISNSKVQRAWRRIPTKLLVKYAHVKQNEPFVRFIRATDLND